MRGHIRRRGTRWAVVIDAGRDETGRRRQKWHSGYATKREASKKLTEILSSIDNKVYVEPSKATVATFMHQWIETQRARLRPATWQSYSMNIESHIVPKLGSTPLQGLTAAALNGLYGDLLTAGARYGKRGLSPRTVRYVATIIKKSLKDAVRWNLLSRNPADMADPPKQTSRPEMQTWTAEQLRAFLNHVQGDRLHVAYLLAATTGLRRGELLGLRWQDVSLDTGRLSVRQTLIAVGYSVSISTPKTQKGRRSVALDPHTLAELKAHRQRQLEDRLAWETAWQDNDLVFCREDGSLIHPDRFTDWFEHHVKAAAVPRIRLHDLRHTHATLALLAGVHPKVISERLGHATVSITLDTYSHAVPAMEEEAAAKVAKLVFG